MGKMMFEKKMREKINLGRRNSDQAAAELEGNKDMFYQEVERHKSPSQKE